jgi:hypothetical protein
MKRKHLNLLMAAAVAALVAAVYFSREKPKPPPKSLIALKPADITRIVIRHEGEPDIELSKDKGEWWLQKPVRARAEAIEVNGVLDLVTREIGSSYPVKDLRLAEMGLDKPKWSVDLNNVHIDFGDLDPLEGRRYARIGDQLHLIGDPPSAALDADYSDLIAKQLIPRKAQIDSIKLRDFTVTRTDKGGWTVEPKARDKGADAAQKLVNAWTGAQSMWNARAGSKEKSTESVTIRMGAEEIRFAVLDRKDQLVLARPELGVKFTVSKALEPEMFELQAPTTPTLPSPASGGG